MRPTLPLVALVGLSTIALAQAPAPFAPVPGTGTLGAATGGRFSFIVAGDSRPHSATTPQAAVTSTIFAAAKTEKAAFVVWTGDGILGLDSADPAGIAAQYLAFFRMARTAGVPVFMGPGNHEMDVKVKGADGLVRETGSAAMEALYRTNFGLAAGAPIYGAFSFGNARFILLDSEEIAPPQTTRSPHANAGNNVNLDPGYISPAQLQWLGAELDANRATHTFLFMHHPIKAKKADMALDKRSADALVALFAKHANISYVLASHEHLYFNPQTNDLAPPPHRTAPSSQPPIYLVSGGAGAPLTGTAADGGFYHYLVFTVDGNAISVRLIRP